MNHQGLLWNMQCIATVVLRKQLNFKSAVMRSKRSCLQFTVRHMKYGAHVSFPLSCVLQFLVSVWEHVKLENKLQILKVSRFKL